jgi:hypothetical protein
VSTNSRFTGEITITPPLNWNKIKATKLIRLIAQDEVRLEIHEQKTDTPDGELIVKTCSRITPLTDSPYRGYYVKEAIQAVIDQNPGHEFSGYIEGQLEDGSYLWRIVAKDGKAHKIEPQITWPEV